ncbi:DEAD/DEAH box helicase [Gilvimarinus polysaccharolyticus]|uniref:DEAD/DEAH box helicase n=1 Tax=Gilvimarinus polysaccharolyticus TaxID=863921 RepID=UPI000A52F92D|nr:DEAD/DEAH box helicase [Gilvimarinus polysaccharolyticus]
MSNSGVFSLLKHPRLQAALTQLEIDEPTPVQARAIPAVLDGADVAVCAPTGSGKTLAFLLPMLQLLLTRKTGRGAVRALVLTPTRELARQIVAEARKLCERDMINVVALTGGDSKSAQRELIGSADLLVATPGRMSEFVGFQLADLSNIEFLVIDEADRTLDMGFSDEVTRIAKACGEQRQTLLYSATLRAKGLGQLLLSMTNPDTLQRIDITQLTTNMLQEKILADDWPHKCQLLAALCQQREFRRAVIFANTRERVNEIVSALDSANVRSLALHGEVEAKVRKQVMARFSGGQCNILVATDLAARGLDIEGIELIINADLPYNVPSFVHRAGRTARADASGTVLSLVTAQGWNLMADIERHLGAAAKFVQLDGLVARYRGPKKVKSSGKAAGKKPVMSRAKMAKKDSAAEGGKTKNRLRDQKNIGKRRKTAAAPVAPAGVKGWVSQTNKKEP